MRDPKKITAREIMKEEVITLYADTPVKEAVATLDEYRVTGAPVLNASGECVGVFSRSDALRRSAEVEAGEAPFPGDYFSVDPELDIEAEQGDAGEWPKSEYDPVMLGEETVGHWMSPQLLAVDPDSSVEEVSRRMATEGVHRVLVLEGKKVRGIITAMDVVRLVAGLERKAGAGA